MTTRLSQMKKTLMIRVITTLIGWAIAFAVVYTIFFFFGRELKSLPTAVVALIISGILVTIMGNFVMPFVGKKVAEYVEKMYIKRKEVV